MKLDKSLQSSTMASTVLVPTNSDSNDLLPSSSSSELCVHHLNDDKTLLQLTYNYDNRNECCRMIVPYVSRQVFPLMYIYLLEEEDDNDEEEHNDGRVDHVYDEEDEVREERGEEQMRREEQPEEGRREHERREEDGGNEWRHPNFNQQHQNHNPHQRQQRRRLRFVFVTLTSSYYPNGMIDHDVGHPRASNSNSNSGSSAGNDISQTQQMMINAQENKRLQIQQQLDHLHTKKFNHDQTQEYKHNHCKKNNAINDNTFGTDDNYPNTNATSTTITHRVLHDIPGILENILTYLKPNDILHCTSYINKRFYNASRDDNVWKLCCIYKWKNKLNTPKVRNWNKNCYYANGPDNTYCASSAATSQTTRNGKRCCDIALFWRMKIDPNIIIPSNTTSSNKDDDNHDASTFVNSPSIHEMKLMLMERPLGREKIRTSLFSCIEKKDLIQLILDLMPSSLGEVGTKYDCQCDSDSDRDDETVNCDKHDFSTGTTISQDNNYNDNRHETKLKNENHHVLSNGFRHLWFGSYASSIIDSKRTTMIIDELLSLNGYSMNLKVVTTTIMSSTTQQQQSSQNQHNSNHRYHEDIQLHFYGMCYFHEDHAFHVEQEKGTNRRGEEDRQEQNLNQNVLTWKWIKDGCILQIERYPPLHVSRMKDWGWKLENDQVVLLSQ